MKAFCFNRFEDLPPQYRPLLEGAGAGDFFYSEAWFQALVDYFYDDPGALRIYGVEDARTGEPLLIFPCRSTQVDPAVKGARILANLGHTENFSPLALIINPKVTMPVVLLMAFFKYLATEPVLGEGAPFDAIRLWPIETDSETGQVIHYALMAAGFRCQTYANSYNRFEDTAGKSHAEYFAERSSNLRHDCRRRLRKLEKDHTVRFELITDAAGLEPAIQDYVTVSDASWKTPASMYAPWNLAFLHEAAAAELLRLGIMKIDGKPVAAQAWIVTGGIAQSLRAAYDEAYKNQSVGALLTNFMVAHVLDEDHAREINFGYGGEEYKAKWMKAERHYFGLIGFNRNTRRGRYFAAKHIIGRKLKRHALIEPLLDAARPPVQWLRKRVRSRKDEGENK